MPISTGGSFDNTGAKYNVSRILTADSTFDLESYEAYSPLFLSTTFAVSYGLSFASITATLTHALCVSCAICQSQSDFFFLHQPLLPQADLDPGSSGHERTARYSRPVNVGLPSSPRVVVRCHLRRHVRLWYQCVVFLYTLISCILTCPALVSIEVWDTKFPVQYFILALVIGM